MVAYSCTHVIVPNMEFNSFTVWGVFVSVPERLFMSHFFPLFFISSKCGPVLMLKVKCAQCFL